MPWFSLEAIVYRLIMDECKFFERRLDPFRPQKLQELVRAAPVIKHIAETRQEYDLATPEVIANLLAFSLWSNSADLSRHPSGVHETLAQDVFSTMPREKAAHVLIDDTTQIIELLRRLSITPSTETVDLNHASSMPLKRISVSAKSHRRTVIIIADNAGIEFISDLLWADALVSSKRVEAVEFHVKYHPTFVSDVTKNDVEDTLYFTEKIAPSLGKRWRHYFQDGIFTVNDHPYYNAYEPYWIVPIDLYHSYRNAEFVVSKGDANARRFHGDRAWDFTLPTKSIISYFPVPLILIRTFKSETVSGVSLDQIRELTANMKRDWYHSGEYGSIQLISPRQHRAPMSPSALAASVRADGLGSLHATVSAPLKRDIADKPEDHHQETIEEDEEHERMEVRELDVNDDGQEAYKRVSLDTSSRERDNTPLNDEEKSLLHHGHADNHRGHRHHHHHHHGHHHGTHPHKHHHHHHHHHGHHHHHHHHDTPDQEKHKQDSSDDSVETAAKPSASV